MKRVLHWTKQDESILQQLVSLCHHENVKRWVRGQFKDYLKYYYPHVICLDDNTYKIEFHDIPEYTRWIQYLNTFPPQKDITRLTVPKLIERIKTWEYSFTGNPNPFGCVEKILDCDNYTWYKLLDKTAIDYENKIMFNTKRDGEYYSLRKNNVPQVTVIVYDNTIKNILGKRNKSIKKEFRQYVEKLIEKLKLTLLENCDISRNEWVVQDNKVFNVYDTPIDYTYTQSDFDNLIKRNVSDVKMNEPVRIRNEYNKVLSNSTFVNLYIYDSSISLTDCKHDLLYIQSSECLLKNCQIKTLEVSNCKSITLTNCSIETLVCNSSTISIKDCQKFNLLKIINSNVLGNTLESSRVALKNIIWKRVPKQIIADSISMCNIQNGYLPELVLPKTGSLILDTVKTSFIPKLHIDNLQLHNIKVVKLPALHVNVLIIKNSGIKVLSSNITVNKLFESDCFDTKYIRSLPNCQKCEVCLTIR